MVIDDRCMQAVDKEKLEQALKCFKTSGVAGRSCGVSDSYFSSVRKSLMCQGRVANKLIDLTGIDIRADEAHAKRKAIDVSAYDLIKELQNMQDEIVTAISEQTEVLRELLSVWRA